MSTKAIAAEWVEEVALKDLPNGDYLGTWGW